MAHSMVSLWRAVGVGAGPEGSARGTWIALGAGRVGFAGAGAAFSGAAFFGVAFGFAFAAPLLSGTVLTLLSASQRDRSR